MKIHNNYCTNLQTFKGIKFSKYDYDEIRDIVMKLRMKGIRCSGKKEFFISNSFKDKSYLAYDIRRRHEFMDNEFRVIFLPWSGESYAISTPSIEQKILPEIQKFDTEAYLNLGI